MVRGVAILTSQKCSRRPFIVQSGQSGRLYKKPTVANGPCNPPTTLDYRFIW